MSKFLWVMLALFSTAYAALAQQVTVQVTEKGGQPVAYHNITLSQGSTEIGYGQTGSDGYAYIQVNGLYGSGIDVAGFYQNGGTKRTWSFKGKHRLDGNNTVYIDLGDPKKDAERRRSEMDERMKSKGFGSDFGKGFGNEDKGNSNLDTDNSSSSSGNNAAAGSGNFSSDLAAVKSGRMSSDKKEKALQIAKNSAMSSSQIKEMMNELFTSSDKKEFAIAAYQNCTDKGNYETVIKELSFSSDQNAVRKATTGK